MTDSIIDRLDSIISERKQHAEALQTIDASLAQIQQLLGGTIATTGPRKRGRPPKSQAKRDGGAVGNGRIASSEPVTLADYLEAVIKSAGEPQAIADLVTGVKSSGYKSKAKDIRPVVSLALLKNARFKRVGRGVYDVR